MDKIFGIRASDRYKRGGRRWKVPIGGSKVLDKARKRRDLLIGCQTKPK
jgi:hypothetical protein